MIDFTFCKILTYQQENNYFSDSFRYASKKELTIQGILYNPANFSGVSGLQSDITNFEISAKDYDEILLNGINFGYGRINSLNFESSNGVRLQNYSASITIFNTGNLFNLTGNYYSGLDTSNLHLINNFSESFDFSIKEDLTYSYTQNINIGFISGAATGGNSNPINMAKSFASGLLFSTPAFGLIDSQHSGFYNSSIGRRFYTESYNLISNECSFSERMDLAPNSGNYSFIYNTDLSIDEDGNANVSENGKIVGLTNNYYQDSLDGYNAEIINSFSRCNEVFNNYTNLSTSYPLVNAHITLNKKINKFAGTIDYNVLYSNNPALTSDYSWEYTQDISKDSNYCSHTIKENGRIKGITNCSNLGGFEKAQVAFASIQSSGLSRILAFYQAATNTSNNISLISSSEKLSPVTFEIDYENTYSDDPYRNVDGFKKLEYSVEDRLPVPYINKYNIINVREIVQYQNISKDSSRTCNLKIIGQRGFILSQYLIEAKKIINQFIPTLDNTFISSCSYNFTPKENTFTITLSWTYFDKKNFTDVLV